MENVKDDIKALLYAIGTEDVVVEDGTGGYYLELRFGYDPNGDIISIDPDYNTHLLNFACINTITGQIVFTLSTHQYEAYKSALVLNPKKSHKSNNKV